MTNSEPTPYQLKIAVKLNINISGLTSNVAGAKISDMVMPAIYPDFQEARATMKQIGFGTILGLDLRNDSKAVASAKIEDKLSEINSAALERLNLTPGVRVKKQRKIRIRGKEETLLTEHVVSSIGKNNRVYFKGGKGQGAWPSQLEPLDS